MKMTNKNTGNGNPVCLKNEDLENLNPPTSKEHNSAQENRAIAKTARYHKHFYAKT